MNILHVICNYGRFPNGESFLVLGSLEETVENLVKTWEMEATHKTDLNQWVTVDPNNYTVKINGVDTMDGSEAKEIGNYNAIMRHCPMYKKCT